MNVLKNIRKMTLHRTLEGNLTVFRGVSETLDLSKLILTTPLSEIYNV